MDTKVFLPDTLLRCDGCFIRGRYVARGTELALYVTAHSADIRQLSRGRTSPDLVYGRYGTCGSLPRRLVRTTIDVDTRDDLFNVSRLVIDHNLVNLSERNLVILFYEHSTILVAENWPLKNSTFSELYDYVRMDQMVEPETRESELEETVDERDKGIWQLLATFMFCVQLKNFYDIVLWIFCNLKKNKRISIKMGNMIAALMTDVVIAYIVLSLVNVRSEYFSETIMSCIETVVNYLRSLLKWLMGAPAGLKLNNAFNNMLGKFFLYHIDLWWMFLELTKGGLDIVSQIYYYFGFLGVTFQAAIISDMISFISFHAYCIYVYVARLFNLQVSGLAALLRLFVGRKRNPLRGGVDSCEYSNQELFAGTVAFTVLLFLLPTTAMYYTVFTLFRLLSLAVQGLLVWLCYLIKSLPLYITLLWLMGSPRIAGNIRMEASVRSGARPLVVTLRCAAPPLRELAAAARPPPVRAPRPARLARLLARVLRGGLVGARGDKPD